MVGTNFPTAGDGRIYKLATLGYKSGSDNVLWQVTFICGAASVAGVANPNGVAVGVDGVLVTWLAPGGSISLLTRDLGNAVWQDVSTKSAVLAIVIQMPATYIVKDTSIVPPPAQPTSN